MKPIIIANWKMNPENLEEAENIFELIKKEIKDIKKAEVIICPPFVYLSPVASDIGELSLGAQNIFFEEKGAYTGEISPKMVKDLGCKYAIIGHSERRKYFNETDEIVNKKIKAALEADLIPIFCVGETEEERKSDKTEEVVKRQIERGLEGIQVLRGLIIAYEPIWAIGTGNPCSVEEAKKMGLFIRNFSPEGIPVLYGGSVNSSNSAGYVKEAKMNGLLVGGASLIPDEFIEIVKSIIE